MINPGALKKGDEVRVIAPSRSLAIISEENRRLANKKIEGFGLKLSFGKNILECDEFNSSSIESRVEDIHDAFLDPNVKLILTFIGGYNSNQILAKLDYDLFRKNPKSLCGFSDITALQNAIWSQSQLVNYSGPHYSSFAMKEGLQYTVDSFLKIFFSKDQYCLDPSSRWSSDSEWFMDQEKRSFEKNQGYKILCPGSAEGTVIGGNLGTFVLLKGTRFMPSLQDSILFLEDVHSLNETKLDFDRNLQSLIDLSEFSGVKAIIFGRFEKSSNISPRIFEKIIYSKPELKNIPIVMDADFGHTTPIFTFPIGGKAKIEADDRGVSIRILKH